jgi:hypothetical protein
MSDWRDGFNQAALDYMVLNGGVANMTERYGHRDFDVYDPWNRTPAATLEHIVACGIDYGKSGPVSGCEWSQFEDTYTTNSDHVGLTGPVRCTCGKVDEQFVIEGSFSEILSGILLKG